MPSSRGNQTTSQSASYAPDDGQHGSSKARPVWSRKVFTGSGTVEVSVWAKVVNEGQQNEFQTYNVSAKRNYKDGDEYKWTHGFQATDVPHLVLLLQQANAYVTEQMNA
jgi:hypothetical protein